jgi:hypothetical protein
VNARMAVAREDKIPQEQKAI